jgi:transposase-like protein
MTYSLDFRRHVLTIKSQERLSFCAASRRFNVGKNTLFLWSKTIKAQNKRNKPATKINMEALQEDIKTYPDA